MENVNPSRLMVESLLEILTKKRSHVQSVTNAIGESIYSISIWNIVNQLGKYDLSCGSVVNNLKERQLFLYQMNRNRFDLILDRRYWNYSTM